MKALLWFLTALWFIGSWFWYVCPHKKVCPWVKSTEVIEDSKAYGPLVFDWSKSSPFTSSQFPEYRDSIIAQLGDQDALQITGHYYGDEENTSTFENMGLARANAIKEQFVSALEDDRIELSSSLMDGTSVRAKADKFSAATFNKLVRNESVREVAGEIIINFPHASADMLENAKLMEYLDDLVSQLKGGNDRIKLVGHTDSSAGADRNMHLGTLRAEAIKDILVGKGISSSRIMTSSMGESQPIADNVSEAGKQKNRRVVLTIVS